MIKNALPNGHSSQVRGWLVIDGVQHELAQVGPDFCILREPISSDSVVSSDIPAELIIDVDGDQRTVAVNLSSNLSFSRKFLQFFWVKAA